jgi:hypothetical protein
MSAQGLRSQNGKAVLLLEFGEAKLQAQGALRFGQVAGFWRVAGIPAGLKQADSPVFAQQKCALILTLDLISAFLKVKLLYGSAASC